MRTAYDLRPAYYAGVDFVVVWCQWYGCRVFYSITHSVDRMLTDDGRTVTHAWIDRGIPQLRQVRYMILGPASPSPSSS